MFTLKALERFLTAWDQNSLDLSQEGCWLGVGEYLSKVTPVVLDALTLQDAKKEMENGLFNDFIVLYVGFDGYDIHSVEDTYENILDWYENDL